MNINGFTTVRVGEQRRTAEAARAIGRTQAALAEAQREVSTGKRVERLSDAAADGAAAMQLRRALETMAAHQDGLRHADATLATADDATQRAVDLLRQARQVGLSSLGTEATDEERHGAAKELDAIRDQLLSIANTDADGVAVFGGANGADRPFIVDGGGVRYVGGDGTTRAAIGPRGATINMLVDAHKVFGSVSRRVGGAADLNPAVTADTRLSDLGGARGEGVARGSIRLVNAGAEATVDLSDADTVGDVVDRINTAGVGVAASIVGGGVELSGASITVEEAGGTTAADLGLPGGDDLDARITVHTPLADLNDGAGLGGGGFTITNGGASDAVDLAGLTTVGDLLTRLDDSPANVDAIIADDGRSLLLRNPVQGTELRVVENGGATAADLGWLTFTAGDPLSDLNGGRGVRLDPDGPDLRLIDGGGVAFDVDLDSAATVDDAIAKINDAALAAGAATTAAFDPALPGLRLTGVSNVTALGRSQAAGDLGLDAPIVAGDLAGRDVNPVTSEGVFGHLAALSEALRTDDAAAATRAMEGVEWDERQATLARGEVGTRLREVQDRTERLADEEVATRGLLGRIEDADFATSVLEFQTLQNGLRAQLQTTGQALNLSLFDYLR